MPHDDEGAWGRRIAREILEVQGIGHRRLERLPGGSVNEVYGVDRSYVVRFSRDPSSAVRLAREFQLVRALDGMIPTPRPVACGQLDGVTYQVAEFVEGVSLADAWAGLDDRDRARIVDDLGDALDRLHGPGHAEFGYACLPGDTYPSWLAFSRAEFDASVDGLVADRRVEVPRDRVEAVRAAFHARSAAIDWGGEAHLVHNDLLPNNILVRDGRLAALVDWELALRGPIDADLYKMEYFCRKPEILGKQGDFTDLWAMMAERCAAMSSVPGLPLRLDVYDLLATWKGFRFEVDAGLADPNDQLPSVLGLSEVIIGGGVSRLGMA